MVTTTTTPTTTTATANIVPLPSARSLRVLQIATIALAIAGNLTGVTFFATGLMPPSSFSALPFSVVGVAAFVALCLRAQAIAVRFGSTAVRSNAIGAFVLCVLVSFIGVPLLVWRTARAVAAAVDDDSVARTATAVAWAIACAPVVGVFVTVFVVAVGGNGAWYFVGPGVGVVLQAIATQLIVAPLVAALDARADLGGVDGDATSAAVRTL